MRTRPDVPSPRGAQGGMGTRPYNPRAKGGMGTRPDVPSPRGAQGGLGTRPDIA